MVERFMVSLAIRETQDYIADIMAAYASNCGWKGSPLTAWLVQQTNLTSQDLGSASVEQSQPDPCPSASIGLQHPSIFVGPVPYIPSDYYGESALGTASVVPFSPVAQDDKHYIQAYSDPQPRANNASLLPNGQSPFFACEEQRYDQQHPRPYLMEVPSLWPLQPQHSGYGYGAGAWMVLEGPYARDPGSDAAPWIASQSPLCASEYLPVSSVVFYSVPSVPSTVQIDPTLKGSGPIHPAQYNLTAPLQRTHHNQDGTPIDLGRGAVSTESRGVFIQNLNYKATAADLTNLMKVAGHIVRCEIKSHPATGKPQGVAVVTFASSINASTALEMFDGTYFMGRQITVRRDRVDQAITNQQPDPDVDSTGGSNNEAQQGPIIVDGSTGRV